MSTLQHSDNAILLSGNEIELLTQWFNALQDLNPNYLAQSDYELARKLYEASNRKLPYSIQENIDKGN